jgi:uncharacterized protein (DUF608 family)
MGGWIVDLDAQPSIALERVSPTFANIKVYKSWDSIKIKSLIAQSLCGTWGYCHKVHLNMVLLETYNLNFQSLF